MNWKGVALLIISLAVIGGCTTTPLLEKRADLKELANKGDMEAQYQLGLSYCCGYGAGHASAQAINWFCRAALQGHGAAQYELGRFYGKRADAWNKQSLRQDLIYAHMWYSLAALQNVPLAAEERNALALDMLPREIQEAGMHVRDWRNVACH